MQTQREFVHLICSRLQGSLIGFVAFTVNGYRFDQVMQGVLNKISSSMCKFDHAVTASAYCATNTDSQHLLNKIKFVIYLELHVVVVANILRTSHQTMKSSFW